MSAVPAILNRVDVGKTTTINRPRIILPQTTLNANSQRIESSQNGFLDFIGKVFNAFRQFVRRIYGVAKPNEVPYFNYQKRFQADLQKELELPMHRGDELSARAQVLFNHSKELIDHVKKHGVKNLPKNLGVHMSPDLSFLAGDNDRQRFDHNCAVNFWATNTLDRLSQSSSGKPQKTILDIEDGDNTNFHKQLATWGTPRIQSLRARHWNKLAYQYANEDLGTELLVNTARCLFPNAIYARNEGLEGSATIGEHGSPLGELFGRSIREQLKAAEFAGAATMNGTLIHRPGKPTYFSSKLIRADEILRYLEKVKVDGKTFLDAYFKGHTEENEFTAAEPKGVTDYLMDTHRILGEVYFPHLLKMVHLKVKYVDRRRSGTSEKQGWQDFKEAIREDVKRGVEAYRELDRLKRIDASEKRLQEARDEAYEHIRLIGADLLTRNQELAEVRSLHAQDYFSLLNKNPQVFFEKVTHGRLTGLTYHYFNSRGTPLVRTRNKDGTYGFDATEHAIHILNQYANNPNVIRKVQLLNSLTTKKSLHPDIERFRNEGVRILKNEGPMSYLNWRLCRHLMHLYTRSQIESIENTRELNEGKGLFDTSNEEELRFSKEFLAQGQKIYDQKGLWAYIEWLKDQFSQKAGKDQYSRSIGPEAELVNFVYVGFSGDNKKSASSITAPDSRGIKHNYDLNDFLPCELFSINNKCRYTDKHDFSSIFALVDKRDIKYVSSSPKDGKKCIFIPYKSPNSKVNRKITEKPLGFYAILGANPDAQYYLELLSGEKFNVVPKWHILRDKNYVPISAGDSKSDIATHVCALDPHGMAEVVFGLINDSDIYKEAIAQRVRYLDDEEKALLLQNGNGHERMSLSDAYKEYGIYALKEVSGNKYRKIIDVQLKSKTSKNTKPEFTYTYLDDTAYTEDEILKEIEKLYENRIIHNRCPEAKIRRRAEIIELLTGRDINFDESKYKLAEDLYEKKESGIPLTEEEVKILNQYRWAVIESKYESYVSQEAPRFRVWYEYHDQNGKVYFRRKEDGVLVSKEGEIFNDDDRALVKIPIERDKNGNFVRIIDGKQEPFKNIEFLNKCLCEEEVLPSASPKGGLFAKNWLLNIFGFGSKSSGTRRLKTFVTYLPSLFVKALEWSGGLMAFGGLLRLASRFAGSFEETLYKTGYWMSNSLRAVSASCGALRGELNVHKHHNIFAGEVINVFAALGLPDGWKHAVLGLGNFVLFLGRGQQRAQMMQRVNNHPHAVLENKPYKDKYVDPRPYVRDVTKFSTQIILDAKKTAKNYGLHPLIGEVVGNIASAVLTPFKMLKDVFCEPKLIIQGTKRKAEKSGESYFAIPSAGHLLTVVGALSGIGALVAGTFGRMKDVAEDGFNNIGKIAISFANAIAAPGIIFNGIEVMGNPLGMPRLSKDLNGKDIMYNPERAGLGQIIAGIGYGILPWFGLHNKNVASMYDVVNGWYFGFPGAKMSVAEEEKLNSIALARNILIEGQQYYMERDNKIVEDVGEKGTIKLAA